ncbi:carbonic anhydrase family protein [Nocardia iowensis]|uniref:Carbonic anhydrase family protein n=2 Tax=Nocardia iowensis TaxID=204891 RepID=A0ABX8S4R2_NOCIO|nr:carbonic anhydrase family protein [Nocardia iowensis]
MGAHAAPHWDYDAEGPDHWAELDQEFVTCKSGHEQSPIDLPGHTRLDPVEHITLDYGTVPTLRLVNTGHAVQANLQAGNGNRLVAEGVPHELTQFHFHLPSEHTVDGAGTTMELHLVHKSSAGKTAVLGVLMQATDGPSAFDSMLTAPPEVTDAETTVEGAVDLRTLLPADLDQFRYQGSLTTPPCSEGVSWTVLEHPVPVATADADRYRILFAHSNRPIQPLNGRSVTLAGG